MARGQPDYGMYAPKTTTGSLSDMGELAVRLGSIVTYDRRGEVVDFDDFNLPIARWGTVIVGIGSYALYSSSSSKTGSQSMMLHVINGAFEHCGIQKYTNIARSKRVGMEISFSNPSTEAHLWIYLSYFDGTTTRRGRLKIDFNGQKLYIIDRDAAEIEVADTGLFRSAVWCFYTVKLVVDFDTGKYVRLMFSDREYDISTTLLEEAPSVEAPTYALYYQLANRVATGSSIFLDSHILTQGEP